MSKIEVNTVEPQCGTTLTLGASGDTITIPSGATIDLSNATQTGVGKAGAVNWQTGSIKTATFTAANGEGYFANTSGGAFTMNLPAGSAGAIVAVSDYTRTFNSNNLTISPNGSEKIGGIAADAILDVNGQAITLVYVDATEGWINVQNAEDTEKGIPPFIIATGGTISTCGNCKIHTFTGPGTFTVTDIAGVCGPTRNQVSYMVVAGGGGGGNGDNTGAGGAGGFREEKAPLTPYTASPLEGAGAITVTATAFPITVGGGGAGGSGSGACGARGTSGSNSIFSTITSAGGGGGGGGRPGTPDNGISGGSGGGAGHQSTGGAGGGNSPPVSPPQGNNGGNGAGSVSPPAYGGGGGGGATAVGAAGTPSSGGAGGAGATTTISGTPTAYAGGGGGGGESACQGGAGGTGGGGAGAGNPAPGCAGTANTGGGGGGTGTGSPIVGGQGGSGIVIIRYKYQ